jgi:micrococcal nuclease
MITTRTRRTLTAAIGVLVLTTGCAGAGDQVTSTAYKQSTAPEDLCELGDCETVTVDRVVDGDTVDVATSSGEIQRVRILGVDTPETKKPNTPVECMGLEASQATSHIAAEGSEATLVTDQAADSVDKYDRRLAHLTVVGTNLGEELLTRGLARTTSFDHSLTDTYAATEDAARDTNAGLWGQC